MNPSGKKKIMKILLNDGTRIDAARTRDGDIVTCDGESVIPVGWTPGDTAGYNVGDYFAQDSSDFGAYLGADEFGIEPIFEIVKS
jgi:hypothetical protein